MEKSVTKKRGALKQALVRDWRLYAMLLLPIAFYLIFCYKPMLGLIIAFQKYNMFKGMWGSKWIGLENFRFVMSMPDFPVALRNTLVLNFMGLIAGFPVPIILAIMLNELKAIRFKKVSQTLLYLPHFLSWIIIGGMALQIFAPSTGIINSLLLKWGWIEKSIPFLTEGIHWQITYTVVGVWQNMGWGTILYLSAITGINMELFEAARIDGANKMQQIWHVTLPGIRSTIIVLLIMNLGHILGSEFDRPFTLSNPLVEGASKTISIFVYERGIQGSQFSLSTAVGLFQSVVCVIFLLLSNWLAKKFGERGVW